MRKNVTAVLSALLALAPAFAVAQVVTHSYSGVVVWAGGPDSDAVREGDPIHLEYALDVSVADLNPSAEAGVYPGSLLWMKVELPRTGISTFSLPLAEGGPGLVQTFNNVASGDGILSDQVFLIPASYRHLGNFGRQRLIGFEVDFLDFAPRPGVIPTMIDSDAVPLHPLLTTNGSLLVRTRAGSTNVQFVAEPVTTPTVLSLARQAMVLIDGAVASGQLTPQAARLLSQPLHAATDAFSAGNPQLACRPLDSFQSAVQKLVRLRGLDAPTGTELLALAQHMKALLGCG